MGRRPCCSKEGLNRGAWTALEDHILTSYIKANGEGQWRDLPTRAGIFSLTCITSKAMIVSSSVLDALFLLMKMYGSKCRFKEMWQEL